VPSYRAWRSIHEDVDQLNRDPFQRYQAARKLKQADETISCQIPEAYIWLLVPSQPQPTGPIEWNEIRIPGDEHLAVKASCKLKHEERLLTELGGRRVWVDLDKVPLSRGDNVAVRQLMEDFAQYLYLPGLKEPDLLLATLRDGVVIP
jgi:hypothetical protein